MMTLVDGLRSAFHEPNTRVYRIVQGAVWALIVLSISLLVVEAVVPDGRAANTMNRVLLSGAHSVYIGRVPGDPEKPLLFGDLLVKMELSKRGGPVIGVRTPKGEDLINSPKSLTLEPGSPLIYLAELPLLDPPA